MLSETSFGQQFWSGPGQIMEIKKKKNCFHFGNKAKDYFHNHLRPLEDFVKEGEGYVLKPDDQKMDPVSVSVQKDNLAPNFAPKPQTQILAINKTDQKQCQLIRAVRGKA